MKVIEGFRIFLHLLVGLGACGGGFGALMDPFAPMGLSSEALKTGPFETFLVPGLFLFIVLGLGNLLVLFLTRLLPEFKGYGTAAIGAVLALWIIIQCIFLQGVVSLHVIFFIIGAVQAVIGILYINRLEQWPVYGLACAVRMKK